MEWILDLRTPELTALFRAFTFFGDTAFFLAFVPLGYWLWRSDLFFRFGLVLLLSTLVNVTLKAFFQVPRPDEAFHLVAADGWSFPSGHAQTAATIWPWLALELGRRWPWPAAAVLVAGVAASRVYLGVHTPRDVIVGVVVGAAIAALGWWWVRRPLGRWGRLEPRRQAAAVVAAVAGWNLVLWPVADAAVWLASGALLGFWLGDSHRRHHLGYAAPRGQWRPLAAAALGLAVLFALWIGLEPLFASFGLAPEVADTVRYLALTVWITGLAPSLFVRLGLAGRS